MTVRTWFRLLRASAWDAQPPLIRVYFRAADPARQGPLTPVFSLYRFTDYLQLIDAGAPTYQADTEWRRLLSAWEGEAALVRWRRLEGLAE